MAEIHYVFDKLVNQLRFNAISKLYPHAHDYKDIDDRFTESYINNIPRNKNKKSQIPKTNISTLETFINCIKNELFKNKIKYLPTKPEHDIGDAINSLFKSDTILLREDKGPKFVLLDRLDYIKRMEKAIIKSNFKGN